MADYSFKILIVGDEAVGKTSLLNRFVFDQFVPVHYATLLVEYGDRQVKVGGKQVLLKISSAPGVRRYRGMNQNYYKNSDGVIIVFDYTSSQSFKSVDGWVKEVKHFCPKEVNIILVGNKSDDTQKREVTDEEVFDYTEQHGLFFVEASAKYDIKVDELFHCLAVSVFKRQVLDCKKSPSTRSKKEDDGDDQDKPKDQGDGKVPA